MNIVKGEKNKVCNNCGEKLYSTNNLIKSILIMVIVFSLFGTFVGFLVSFMDSSNDVIDNNTKIDELKEEEAKLLSQMNEEFFSNGLSNEYYALSSKYQDVKSEEMDLSMKVESNTSELSDIFVIISFVVPIVFFMTFFFVFVTIIKNVKHFNSNFTVNFQKSVDTFRNANSSYVERKCPNCHAGIKGNGDIEVCEYCGASLVKTFGKGK